MNMYQVREFVHIPTVHTVHEQEHLCKHEHEHEHKHERKHEDELEHKHEHETCTIYISNLF